MNWLGIGLLAPPNRTQNIPFAGDDLPLVSPSSEWTGAAGSGFSVLPVDPERTTAKPAMRLLVPPFQHFTDSIDVGVVSVANDRGGLIGGIDRVRFKFEGQTQDVVQTRWHSFEDVNGSIVSYWGYWVRLKKPAQIGGTAHLYVEAIPADATMQKRVIGPYVFSPSSTQYDLEIEVAASPTEITGQRYKTLKSAISYAKGQGARNPLITIKEAGRYDIGDDGGLNHWDNAGYSNITASVPNVFIGKETLNLADANIAPNRTKLHLFGRNLTLDRKFVGALLYGNSETRTHWLDGITITDTSPGGRDELWDGGVRNPRIMFPGGAWFTECSMSEVYSVPIGARLLRGCKVTRHGADIITGAVCVVQSTFDDHSDEAWNTEIPAFSVQYAGNETVANLARSGGAEGTGTAGGIYTCTIGATSYTFDVGSLKHRSDLVGVEVDGRTIDGWFFGDVVDWLNTLPGITATLLIAPDRRANTGSLTTARGQGFGATDIKATTLTIQSYTDVHGDWYQTEVGSLENVIVGFNRHTNAQTQNVLLSPINGGQIKDMLFFGNICNTEEVEGAVPNYGHSTAASQLGRPDVLLSHVCFAQNSFVNQRWLVRTDNPGFHIDSYSLFANNIAPSFTYTNGRLATEMDVRNNRFYDGASPPPGSINTIITGTGATLFTDEEAGDYTPSGPNAEIGLPPAIPFDMNQNAFINGNEKGDAAGAIRTSLGSGIDLYVPPPPSADPFSELLTLIQPAGGESAVHDYTQATVNGNLWSNQDLSSLGNDHYIGSLANHPAISAAGATFDANDIIVQEIPGNTLAVIMSFTKADASSSGVIISDSGGSVVVQYADGATASPHAATQVRVNGNITSSRDALYEALQNSGECVVSMEGLNLTARTQLRIGRGSGNPVGAIVRRIVVLDQATLGTDLGAAITLAEQWVAQD